MLIRTLPDTSLTLAIVTICDAQYCLMSGTMLMNIPQLNLVDILSHPVCSVYSSCIFPLHYCHFTNYINNNFIPVELIWYIMWDGMLSLCFKVWCPFSEQLGPDELGELYDVYTMQWDLPEGYPVQFGNEKLSLNS